MSEILLRHGVYVIADEIQRILSTKTIATRFFKHCRRNCGSDGYLYGAEQNL
jgi:bifunctional pyridoxal-dependent enzyme with beta-cystathionase and maltose regulon repressor activities